MRKCVYAYTDLQFKEYPGYISINEEGPDAISIAVRSPENGGNQGASITLTRDQALSLALDILAHLSDTQP